MRRPVKKISEVPDDVLAETRKGNRERQKRYRKRMKKLKTENPEKFEDKMRIERRKKRISAILNALTALFIEICKLFFKNIILGSQLCYVPLICSKESLQK